MSVQLLLWVLDPDWLLQKLPNISSYSLRPLLAAAMGFKRCPQMLTLYLAVCVPIVSSQSRLLNLEGTGCARDIDPDGTECVSSLNYPHYYDNSAECRMYVVSDSVSVEIISFSTENFYDVLEVTDAGRTDRFSGDCCPLTSSSNGCAWDLACGSFPAQLSPNSMLLWSSDSSRVDIGWDMCFFITITKDGSLVDVSGSGCLLEVQRDGTECVSSSNFPATYDNAGECEVQVTSQAVVMDVIAFETEPYFDVLTVTTSGVTLEYHGLCNTLTCPSFITHLSPMSSLRWTADPSVAEKGWKICFNHDNDYTASTTQEDTGFGVPVSFISVVIGASCCCLVLCGAFCCLLIMALQKRLTAPATESVFDDVVLGEATTVDSSASNGDNSPGEAQQDNNDLEDNPDCAVPA